MDKEVSHERGDYKRGAGIDQKIKNSQRGVRVIRAPSPHPKQYQTQTRNQIENKNQFPSSVDILNHKHSSNIPDLSRRRQLLNHKHSSHHTIASSAALSSFIRRHKNTHLRCHHQTSPPPDRSFASVTASIEIEIEKENRGAWWGSE
ncbi:hypothetical protein Droror1_Dr00002406 [Drosera rotundifolia]